MPDTEALVRFAKRVSHDVNHFSTVIRAYHELLRNAHETAPAGGANDERPAPVRVRTVVVTRRSGGGATPRELAWR